MATKSKLNSNGAFLLHLTGGLSSVPNGDNSQLAQIKKIIVHLQIIFIFTHA